MCEAALIRNGNGDVISLSMETKGIILLPLIEWWLTGAHQPWGSVSTVRVLWTGWPHRGWCVPWLPSFLAKDLLVLLNKRNKWDIPIHDIYCIINLQFGSYGWGIVPLPERWKASLLPARPKNGHSSFQVWQLKYNLQSYLKGNFSAV